MKACANCGRLFKPVKANNKYCGAECCSIVNNKRYELRRRENDRAYRERKKARMEGAKK
jgi:hypothetical protein